MKKIIIAIDGYAGCGKSTTAKLVAERLGYVFIDTGAMYRAVTYYFVVNEMPLQDLTPHQISQIHIVLKRTIEGQRVMLNHQDITDKLRLPIINERVSEVSALKSVRQFLVKIQQEMGKEKGIVMDGRDIGTVVFPNAELKIFMQASLEARVKRRFAELQQNHIFQSEDEIRHNLIERDRQDTSRVESPLRKAEDAIVIDTSFLTIEEQTQKVLALAYEKIYE